MRKQIGLTVFHVLWAARIVLAHLFSNDLQRSILLAVSRLMTTFQHSFPPFSRCRIYLFIHRWPWSFFETVRTALIGTANLLEALRGPKRLQSIRTWLSFIEYQLGMLRLDENITCLLEDWQDHNDIVANANDHKYPCFAVPPWLLTIDHFPHFFRLLICEVPSVWLPLVVHLVLL